MSWEPDSRGILRWEGEFPEPTPEELLEYGHFSHTMHGTEDGYQRHKELGLNVCSRCQSAHDGKPKRKYRRRT